MSDLQCAATVVVARHGEAEYDLPGVSDDGGSLTLAGRQQALALAEQLADRRIASVWCSDLARAVQTAEIVAGALGCGVRVRAGLREFGVGDWAGGDYRDAGFAALFESWRSGDLDVGPPGAETGAQVVARMAAELESIADAYRGETCLVVTHGGSMTMALPWLARNVAADLAWGHSVPNCGTAEMAVDADGWVLRSWPGLTIG